MKNALNMLFALLLSSLAGNSWADPQAQSKTEETAPEVKKATNDNNKEEEATTEELMGLGQNLKERTHEELDALRDAAKVSTEYTLNPTSVELVVEMDPRGYGFRTRTHKMITSVDIDLVLRGRTMLHYDYRFFNYFSVGLMLGIDWTDISLYSRFRQHMASPTPWQFSVLGGISGKWRLTEWYLRSSFFLEPSLLVGHMWQKLASEKSTHWRLRPGVFGGVESVFDSGFSVITRVGVEFPFDFGDRNSYKEIAEPLFLLSFGFAV